MPQILDACAQSVVAGWKSKPESRPKHKEGQDAQSQAFAMCTASLKKAGKLEHGDEEYFLSADKIEFTNPVMTAWAFTNKPFVQGLDTMSFVSAEGKPWADGDKFLKIPLLILGAWKHAMGVLDFTKGFVQKLEKNFREGVAGHEIAADSRHRDTLGALAWATGKFMMEKNRLGLDQWSVLARPTPQGEQFVQDRVYKYGSIEFHPDFKNRKAQAALSADGIVGIWDEKSVPGAESIDLSQGLSGNNEEDNSMPDGTENNNGQGITLESLQEQLAKLQASSEQLQTSNQQLQTDITTRNSRIVGLERVALEQFVDAIVVRAKARREGSGRAHSKVFLEWLQSILTSADVGADEKVVQLEEKPTPGQIHAYYRKAIAWLAMNKPGDGPLAKTAGTEGVDARLGNGDDEDPPLTAEDESMLDDVWSLEMTSEGGE